MKKTTAKEKTNKSVKDSLVEGVDEIELDEIPGEEVPVTAELDPDVLKALNKPKKSKNGPDATDYIPELERDDSDDDFRSGTDDF